MFASLFAGVVLAACSGSSSSTTASATPGGSTSGTTTPSATGSPQSQGQTNMNQSLLDLPSVVDKVKPATVQITSKQVQLNLFSQPFSTPSGVGSGVIYDSSGLILTNNHVIAGGQQLEVSLPDGRSFAAKLLGADPPSDLAVIKIDGANLPVAKLGEASKLVYSGRRMIIIEVPFTLKDVPLP